MYDRGMKVSGKVINKKLTEFLIKTEQKRAYLTR